jgi:hypothetical protein
MMRQRNNRKRNRSGRGRNKRQNIGNSEYYGSGNYKLPLNGYTTRQRSKITFLDPHMYVTMRYAEYFSPSNVTLAGSQVTMRMNSIFDPNSAVGGTQPYGYDQLAALYNRYRVLKCRWRITFSASTAGYSVCVVPVNGALNATVADQTTFTSATMVPYAQYRNYNLGGIAPIVRGRMDLNVLGGVTSMEYLTDDRFEAQIGANPAEVISLIIAVYNPSAGTIVSPFFVEIWYEVDLHDPISLAAS